MEPNWYLLPLLLASNKGGASACTPPPPCSADGGVGAQTAYSCASLQKHKWKIIYFFSF